MCSRCASGTHLLSGSVLWHAGALCHILCMLCLWCDTMFVVSVECPAYILCGRCAYSSHFMCGGGLWCAWYVTSQVFCGMCFLYCACCRACVVSYVWTVMHGSCEAVVRCGSWVLYSSGLQLTQYVTS